jgi:hypothetical protein
MQAARMINEIVVAEETDVPQDGHGHASHYELYVEAMEEIGANTFFLFGRENLIPDMFRKIVEGLVQTESVSIDAFRYYLDRHIGIDEEEPGPASVRMMKSLCSDNDMRWRLVKRAAEESLMARIQLWDGIAEAIEAVQ